MQLFPQDCLCGKSFWKSRKPFVDKVGNPFVDKVKHGTLSPFGGTWIWGRHGDISANTCARDLKFGVQLKGIN